MNTRHIRAWILLALLSTASSQALAAGEKDEAIKFYREGKHAADLGEEVEKSNLPEAAMALYTEAIGKFRNAEELFGKCPNDGCQAQRHEVRVELARIYVLAHRLYRAQSGGDAAVEHATEGPAARLDLTIADCANLSASDPRDDCERLFHAKALYDSFRTASPAVTEKLLAVAAAELPKIDAELRGYAAQIAHLKAKAEAEAEAEAKAKAEAEAQAIEQARLDEQREREKDQAVNELHAAQEAEAKRLARQSRRQLWAGAGLTVGGGALGVIGVAVSLPVAAAYQRAVDAPMWPTTLQDALALETKRHGMRGPYYSAWVTGTVGGAVLLSGVALIITTVVVKKRKQSAASSTARLHPGLGGWEVRF